MATPLVEMQTYSARLSSFKSVQQVAKRRASSQANKKRKDGTIGWPHKAPSPEDLARAGFFYQPDQGSTDNVQCFLCTVKLDGWEETDDPIREHLAHSKDCGWALSVSAEFLRNEHSDALESYDPMSDALVTARQRTFAVGAGWPHESKKGWKCKVNKMVDAGWIWDPQPDTEEPDGVTCYYCDLSLDGWEPKDDPMQEHNRRMPECKFFLLLEQHKAATAGSKPKKGKGKAKASVRSSAVSKASRNSSQSVMSDITSIAIDSSLPGVDDSVVSTATTASQATTTGASTSKKNAGRPKAAAKGTKGRKKTAPNPTADVDMSEAMVEPMQAGSDTALLSSRTSVDQLPGTSMPVEPKKRPSKSVKQIESSIIENTEPEPAPSKKGSRARKPKVQKASKPGPPPPEIVPQTPDAAAAAKKRESEVSTQLQDELEHSMETALEDVQDESTPQIIQPPRGVKRTSDGRRKQSSSLVEIEFPVPPKTQPETKQKRSRKLKQTSAADSEVNHLEGEAIEADAADQDAMEHKNGKGRRKNASSIQSNHRGKPVATKSSQPSVLQLPADFGNDEMEIEKELDRITAEESVGNAVRTEQERIDEFEPSPSNPRQSFANKEMQALEQQVQAESRAQVLPQQTHQSQTIADFTPSPSGSDKENQPSSLVQQSIKQTQPATTTSPTKPSNRIPLAPGTPNRAPAKALTRSSPSKHISHLTSSLPWTAIDLETVLLPSPQPTPGRLGQQLVDAAGALTSPEKTMNVEEWIRFRAERSEEELRGRCEEMVGAFERQGMRALESLEGLSAA